MILTFAELGIEAKAYNGMTYLQAFPLIINTACDYLMWNCFKGRLEDECIPDPMGGFVNFLLQTVELDTAIPSIH